MRCSQRRRAVAARDRTAALVTIANAVIDRFAAEKDRRGLLDYDDLIEKTLALFGNVSAAWVHYKLDLGIDHLLIDEAQDTSPKQWEIIRALVGEFIAGAGAHAAPAARSSRSATRSNRSSRSRARRRSEFDEHAHATFGSAHRARSNATCCSAAQAIRSAPGRTCWRGRHGVRRPKASPRAHRRPGRHHRARGAAGRGARPRRNLGHRTSRPSGARSKAGTRRSTRSPKRARWCGWRAGSRGIGCGRGSGRAGAPGDVLILVRQRGALFEAIIRALKNAGIPVAGADRLVLTEHIAVMDLMVLADALLLPRRRSRARDRAQEPAVRLRRRRPVRDRLGSRKASLRAALARQPARTVAAASAAARPARASGPRANARSRSMPSCSAPSRAASGSWRGSATKPPTRSTNSSISRSTTRAARRRRCRASSPGCGRRNPRSSATWRSRATRCG